MMTAGCYHWDMVERKTEIGIKKIFRGYCGFVLVYLLSFLVFIVLTTRTFFTPSLLLFYTNIVIFASLFGYLSWTWLEKRMGVFYFPVAILIATLIPMYSLTYFWPLQQDDAISDIIFRSWYLLPILIVPFTLIAWQYGYKVAVVFAIILSFYDLPFIVLRINSLSLEMVQMLSVPLLRAIALGTIGVIVGMLMDRQRSQRRKLMQANLHLSKYAETLEELATSRERNRLARELHDTLAHTLSSQILSLEALRLSPPEDPRELDQALEELIENSRKGLAETRRALKDLRVKQLEDLGLQQSLISIIQNAASRAHLETELDIPKNMALMPYEIEHCIYRVAQEGVENIIRHASATEISMALKQDHSGIFFTLKDNGRGFDIKKIDKAEKHGITGMCERIADCGGKFKITSNPRSGTKIIVEFEVENDSRISL